MMERFGAASRWAHLGGPVHYADFGGEGRPIVCVHGLGGSHTNWLAVGRPLAAHGRVLAPDLGGFGRTPPHRGGAAVEANRRLLSRFLTEVAGGPAILVGNSMGAAISILQAAAEPGTVAGLVLVGPALPRAPGAPMDPAVAARFAAYAAPGVGEAYVRARLRRRGAEELVVETIRLCTVDPDRVAPEIVSASVAVAEERSAMPWAHRSFLTASRTLMRTLLRRTAFDEKVSGITAPGLIIQGDGDRLVPEVNTARLAALRPDWRYELLAGVGHAPQVEVPDRFVALVAGWLAGLPAGAGPVTPGAGDAPGR